MENKRTRGGVRPGAGRKPISDSDKAKTRSIKLTDQDWQRFRELGGVKWIRSLIHK